MTRRDLFTRLLGALASVPVLGRFIEHRYCADASGRHWWQWMATGSPYYVYRRSDETEWHEVRREG